MIGLATKKKITNAEFWGKATNNDIAKPPVVDVYLVYEDGQRRRPEPPAYCSYHSLMETCRHCGHPEYCPTYGFRTRS